MKLIFILFSIVAFLAFSGIMLLGYSATNMIDNFSGNIAFSSAPVATGLVFIVTIAIIMSAKAIFDRSI